MRDPRIEILELIDERERRARFNKIARFYPDIGPLRRELYPKHMRVFEGGATCRERCMQGGNGTGKTEGVGAYEVTLHATGEYPDWWVGRRYDRPTDIWVAGDTKETVRDITQVKLIGDVAKGGIGALGTGMIPRAAMLDPDGKFTGKFRQGTNYACDFVRVKHKSGGHSTVGFKCHPAGSRVLMASGEWKPIETIRLGESILSPDGAVREVTQTHAYANAPVLRINTRSGSVEATPNHPMFTQRGTVNAGDVVSGDVLDIPDVAYEGVAQERWRVCMTALMIGDGCMRGKTPFFTCNEPPMVEMVREILPDDMFVVPITNTISYKVSSKLHKNNRLKESLKVDGLWGKLSLQKYIPSWVFELPRVQRVEFLQWLWSCDGGISSKNATYTSSSKRLIDDVRALLWSVGIRAYPRSHVVSNQSRKKFQSYYLPLAGENRIKFSEIGKINRSTDCDVKPRPKGPEGEVLSIECVGTKDVYCIGVDDVHELIVEGYRVGNSYDQRRESFQGTEKDLIWLDEEPPMDIYTECLFRGRTVNGMILLTFTPLSGPTDVVRSFGRTAEDGSSKMLVKCRWDDVPHLTEEEKAQMLAGCPPYLREARMNGEAVAGAGRIYPVDESEFVIKPLKSIPDHWPRIFGIDCGWRMTAAVWLAHDRDTDIVYLYSDYYRGEAEVPIHAAAVKAHGHWIPGIGDVAGGSQTTGDTFMDLYRKQGLMVRLPNKAVEAGIATVLERLSTGRLKVYNTCEKFLDELRRYSYDDKGRVRKEDDHGLDAMRYAIMGLEHARVRRADPLPSTAEQTFGLY